MSPVIGRATAEAPYKARILYLMANFINDVAHENNLVNSVIEDEIADYDGNGRTPQALLGELDEAIMSLDYAKSTAVANAYLTSGVHRRPYMETVALVAPVVSRTTRTTTRLTVSRCSRNMGSTRPI